ncbi:MAG: hypothetical protein HYZ91_06475 [Candidatus Omnitrophica bacterium]|nr:hypothetical protein [Candidatus Omnitrophota bacterium]
MRQRLLYLVILLRPMGEESLQRLLAELQALEHAEGCDQASGWDAQSSKGE